MVRKSIVNLEEIKANEFAKIQKNSKKPVVMRQFIINEDDYQYMIKRMIEIEKELEERSPTSMGDRGSLFKEEKYLISYFGLPDIESDKKEQKKIQNKSS